MGPGGDGEVGGLDLGWGIEDEEEEGRFVAPMALILNITTDSSSELV